MQIIPLQICEQLGKRWVMQLLGKESQQPVFSLKSFTMHLLWCKKRSQRAEGLEPPDAGFSLLCPTSNKALGTLRGHLETPLDRLDGLLPTIFLCCLGSQKTLTSSDLASISYYLKTSWAMPLTPWLMVRRSRQAASQALSHHHPLWWRKTDVIRFGSGIHFHFTLLLCLFTLMVFLKYLFRILHIPSILKNTPSALIM